MRIAALIYFSLLLLVSTANCIGKIKNNKSEKFRIISTFCLVISWLLVALPISEWINGNHAAVNFLILPVVGVYLTTFISNLEGND